jgi:formylglycine-generating enzyme required for sulfatase activity
MKIVTQRLTAVAGVVMLGVLAGYSFPANSASPAAREAFRDCADCPEMLGIPAGEFTMGSSSGELYRGDERQHRVAVGHFALGKYEITFAQWDACVAGGGCGGQMPDDQGWGRGNRPVIGINWNDAKAYAEWLSRKTGKQYRLPSEAEWEYAARAGTTTPFSFGNTITTTQANFDGSTGYGTAPAGINRQKTMPVGSFSPNGFGLYDMHGNVWEWTEDCWSDEYAEDRPANATPYSRPDCEGRVLRGGSWEDYPGDVRAAARVGSSADESSWSDGFRVARSLD